LLGAGYGIVLAETGWAVLALALALVFAVTIQRMCRGVWSYGLAVGWGFAGIAVANLGSVMLVAVLAAIAALLMLGLAARDMRR